MVTNHKATTLFAEFEFNSYSKRTRRVRLILVINLKLPLPIREHKEFRWSLFYKLIFLEFLKKIKGLQHYFMSVNGLGDFKRGKCRDLQE
ncbi:hypothetical protein RIR_jg16238.t1 [Rhizophagus irregularis DAOM 181602=DAOM 197198]|nr:hypothetical protein RIR_jg16238.t1 [Rhizophagus irregularis DAOM 181602=DAOM 197198]